MLRRLDIITFPKIQRVFVSPSPYLEKLIEGVTAGDDLLTELTAGKVNIAGLMPCDGAVSTLGGQVRSLGEATDQLALRLVDELRNNLACELYFTHAWEEDRDGQVQEAFLSVLAVRFNPSEDGWLFWLRKLPRENQVRAPWSDVELALVQHLRVALLQVSLTHASRTSKVQSRLIRRMAHDLSNPLQSISMSASLLRPEDDRSRQLRGQISDASARLNELIVELRELDHLCRGDCSLELTRTDLSGLVATEVKRICEAYQDAPVTLEVAEYPEAPLDPDRFARLLGILLDNALRYRLPDTPVRVSLVADRTGSILTVANQADPLPEQDLKALLAPAALGTSGDQNPQGLGLYLASAIAHAHGCTLAVSQNKGWIHFTVTLPPGENLPA